MFTISFFLIRKYKVQYLVRLTNLTLTSYSKILKWGRRGLCDSPLEPLMTTNKFPLQERDPKAVTASTASPSVVATPNRETVAARKMVELTPLTGARGDKQFNRFLAVP